MAYPTSMIEPLESRRLFADVPYNPYNGTLIGQFVTAVPLEVVGGREMNWGIRLTNNTREPIRGLIDLTFSFTPVSADPNATTRPTPTRLDPRVDSLQNVLLNLRPRQSQTFRSKGVLPDSGVSNGEYWFAVAVDIGGSIAQGFGFGGSYVQAGRFPTTYRVPYTDVRPDTFSFRVDRANGNRTGRVTLNLINSGIVDANGSITVRVFVTSRSVNADLTGDTLVGQQTITLDSLRPGRRRRLTVPFQVGPGIPAGEYFGAIALDRAGLPQDLDDAQNATAFTVTRLRIG